MRDRWLRLSILLLAVGVGVFHGAMKPRLDQREIDAIQDHVARSAVWEYRYPPDFEAPLLEGGTFRLADQVGRKLIAINFFATWCGPCRDEMPELERFAQAHRDEGFLLVAIDVQEEPDQVREFVEQLGYGEPVVLDRDGGIAASYAVTAYPTTLLVGADGRVLLREEGAILNADVAFLDRLVDEREELAAGEGVTRDAWLQALAEQPALESDGGERATLSGRVLEIADAMDCPCGCQQKVSPCGCQTAKRIEHRLADMPLDGSTDAAIIEALNREFCVGAPPRSTPSGAASGATP